MKASLSYHEVMSARAAAAAEPIDRYHQGAGRDCPDCDPNWIPAGLKVTGMGEGLLGYPQPLKLQQVVIETPELMPHIDAVGTLDMFEAIG